VSSDLYSCRFVLAVRNLKRSTDYYRDVLSLRLDFEAPGWSFMSRDSFQVMLGECVDAMAPSELGDHSYYAYVNVRGIDALYDELKKKGAETMSEPTDKPWGLREFGVRTIDGHRIMFGQDIES
jgi:uncharacterized glyoxalase superfamily protein PhnB